MNYRLSTIHCPLKKDFFMQSVFRNHVKFILVLFALFQISCGGDAPPAPPSPSNSETALVVPKFSRDSAYNYIAKQVEFGPSIDLTMIFGDSRYHSSSKLYKSGDLTWTRQLFLIFAPHQNM